MKLVLVEWIDSHSGRGWQSIEKLKEATEPLHCKSVGWLMAKSKASVVIVPHINGEAGLKTIYQGCGELSIPRKSIIRTTVLRQ